MITFRVSADVKDDHRVELILPSEVPTGKAELVVSVSPSAPQSAKLPRTPLADWAEQHAEHWGPGMNAEDVAGFTGRRF